MKKTDASKMPLMINNRYVKIADTPLHPVEHKKGTSPYATSNKKVKVTLVKSTIACLEGHKRTVEALGLKKIRDTKILPDNDAIRGMIFKVKHLVKVEEVK